MGDEEQDRTRDYVVLREHVHSRIAGVESASWDEIATVTATSRAQAFDKAKQHVDHDGKTDVRLRLIPARYCGVVTWRQTQTVLDTVEGL